MGHKLHLNRFTIEPGEKVKPKHFNPKSTGGLKSRRDGELILAKALQDLRALQDLLYAQKQYGLVIILQGMDASGKDGVVRHVMSGGNPNWCTVMNFKVPSSEELAHDFLWRCIKALPQRGTMGIFNRSYYEEALIVRIRPEILAKQHLPPEAMGPEIWDKRFESMNDFERHLARNGFPVLKFFLHISKDEQKKRLLRRIEKPHKNWKFSLDDIKKRKDWKLYMRAYEDILENTSTKHAPWHIIPADNKWFARALVASIIVRKLKKLNLDYPVIGHEDRHEFLEAKMLLENEK